MTTCSISDMFHWWCGYEFKGNGICKPSPRWTTSLRWRQATGFLYWGLNLYDRISGGNIWDVNLMFRICILRFAAPFKHAFQNKFDKKVIMVLQIAKNQESLCSNGEKHRQGKTQRTWWINVYRGLLWMQSWSFMQVYLKWKKDEKRSCWKGNLWFVTQFVWSIGHFGPTP